jgi:hypothetical protein
VPDDEEACTSKQQRARPQMDKRGFARIEKPFT